MVEEKYHLAHQFTDIEQQNDSYQVGMWTFLVTEIMFFGALFFAYALYRHTYHATYIKVSQELDTKLGFVNTLILLTSSLTMAFAVKSAHLHKRKGQIGWLFATMLLAFCFLGVKTIEYGVKIHHHHVPGPNFQYEGSPAVVQQAQLFFSIYFAMTGLHAIHVIIGILMMAVFMFLIWRKHPAVMKDYMPLEMAGLYWHFVDIVWIFLYPLLYLIHPQKVF